jgi:hypothetical protein
LEILPENINLIYNMVNELFAIYGLDGTIDRLKNIVNEAAVYLPYYNSEEMIEANNIFAAKVIIILLGTDPENEFADVIVAAGEENDFASCIVAFLSVYDDIILISSYSYEDVIDQAYTDSKDAIELALDPYFDEGADGGQA